MSLYYIRVVKETCIVISGMIINCSILLVAWDQVSFINEIYKYGKLFHTQNWAL